MTGLVFLLLLPAVVVLAGTWAWRYQLRVQALVRRPHRGGGEVALTAVLGPRTAPGRADLRNPRSTATRPTSFALDDSSVLATLHGWARDHARLFETIRDDAELLRAGPPRRARCGRGPPAPTLTDPWPAPGRPLLFLATSWRVARGPDLAAF